MKTVIEKLLVYIDKKIDYEIMYTEVNADGYTSSHSKEKKELEVLRQELIDTVKTGLNNGSE